MGQIKFVVLLSVLVGCSTRLPPEGVSSYHNYDYRKAISLFREKSKDDNDKDVVLYRLALLSSAMAAGDAWDAEKAASDANRVISSNEGAGKGMASLLSAESLKIFKGEPFERAMVSIYQGILFYNRGEFDNARAAFGKALLTIRMKEEKHREDFALPYLLQAKAMIKNGDNDTAKQLLEKARKASDGNSYLDFDKVKESNAIFLVEIGHAPVKFRSGPGASLADWRRPPYPEKLAYIYIDGKEAGRSQEIGDLTHQAKTKGWVGKDTAQVTKGATREAAAITALVAADAASKGNKDAEWVALGAGAFALANQSQADVRQWEFLPDRIHVVLAKVPDGMHDIDVAFYDQFGRVLSEYGQNWYHIPIGKKDDRIFLFRSGPHKNMSGGG